VPLAAPFCVQAAEVAAPLVYLLIKAGIGRLQQSLIELVSGYLPTWLAYAAQHLDTP
jgi:hypothetical protein